MGVNGSGSAFEDFCNLVDALVLHDIPLQGFSFTFFGYGQNVACSRIDRFLISDGARPGYFNISQRALFHFVSDTIPI